MVSIIICFSALAFGKRNMERRTEDKKRDNVQFVRLSWREESRDTRRVKPSKDKLQAFHFKIKSISKFEIYRCVKKYGCIETMKDKVILFSEHQKETTVKIYFSFLYFTLAFWFKLSCHQLQFLIVKIEKKKLYY